MNLLDLRSLSLTTVLSSALLSACATPTVQRDPSPPKTAAIAETITVHSVRGGATVQNGVTRIPLRRDMRISEGQPIQVGPGSHVQLNLGKRALLDLGQRTRLVVHKLPRDGDKGDRATWLRLETGYLHVIWSGKDDTRSWPLEVSFSRWAAKAEAGEYFFDSARHSAAACAFRGDLQFSGVPENTPRELSSPCVNLRADTQPQLIALRDTDWDVLRKRRAMAPVLRNAAAFETAQALAKLRQEMKQLPPPARRASPVQIAEARRPAKAPVTPTPNPRRVEVPIQKLPSSPAREMAIPPQRADRPPEPQLYAQVAPVVVIEEPLRVEMPAAPEPERVVQAVDPVPEPIAVDPVPEPIAVAHAPPVIVIEAPAEAPAPAETELALLAPPPVDPSLDSPLHAHVPPVIEIHAPSDKVSEPPLQPTPEARAEAPSPVSVAPALPPLDPPQQIANASVATASPYLSFQMDTELSANLIDESPLIPAPGTGTAAAGSSANEWMVNVASYSSAEHAEQQVRELRSQGFSANVRSEIVRGRGSYRVVIDELPTEDAALTTVSELDTRLGLQSAWVLRKR